MLSSINNALALFSILVIIGLSIQNTSRMYQKAEERTAENAMEILNLTFEKDGMLKGNR